MAVLRIVANIEAADPRAVAAFYVQLLGLDPVMNHGWIVTLASDAACTGPQVSVALEGGSGAPVPRLSVEVDDLDAVHARGLEAGAPIVYGLRDEPWGVRRFFVRDPVGTVINILSHTSRPGQ